MIVTKDADSLNFVQELDRLRPPKNYLFYRPHKKRFIRTYNNLLQNFDADKLEPVFTLINQYKGLKHYQKLNSNFIKLAKSKDRNYELDQAARFQNLINKITESSKNIEPHKDELKTPEEITGPSPFDSLPNENVQGILSFLSSSELASCRLVCRRFDGNVKEVKEKKYILFALQKVLKGKQLDKCSTLDQQIQQLCIHLSSLDLKNQNEQIEQILKELKQEVLNIPSGSQLVHDKIRKDFEEFLLSLMSEPTCPIAVRRKVVSLTKEHSLLRSYRRPVLKFFESHPKLSA